MQHIWSNVTTLKFSWSWGKKKELNEKEREEEEQRGERNVQTIERIIEEKKVYVHRAIMPKILKFNL